MSGYLLDTNVISEVLRPLPNIRVMDWCREVPKEVLHLSVVSLGEIRKGLTSDIEQPPAPFIVYEVGTRTNRIKEDKPGF